MTTSRTPFLFSVAALALTASSVASAGTYYHPDGTERGVTSNPDHLASTKTRADVNQELADLKKRGLFGVSYNSWSLFQSRSGASGKTRAEVQTELRNVTAAQKQQWTDLYGKN